MMRRGRGEQYSQTVWEVRAERKKEQVSRAEWLQQYNAGEGEAQESRPEWDDVRP